MIARPGGRYDAPVRRLARIPLNAATAVSLALCAAAVTLWVRSYGGSDSVTRRWMTAADAHHVESRAREIQWTLGQVRFLIRRDASYYPAEMTPDAARPHWSYFRYGAGHVGWEAPRAESTWNRLGFAAWETGWSSSFADSHARVWAAPAWLPAVILGVLPAARACGAYRRRRRQRIGRCPA